MQGYSFPQSDVETVVGNGRLITRARAGTVAFVYSNLIDRLLLRVDEADPAPEEVDTLARPGNTVYTVRGRLAVTYAAAPDAQLVLAHLRATGDEPVDVALEFEGEDLRTGADGFESVSGTVRLSEAFAPPEMKDGRGHASVRLEPGAEAAVAIGAASAFLVYGDEAPETLIERWEATYRDRGLALETPDPRLNLAVDFMKYHLQLGYAWPEKMVCDLFRWRDVWSRDFGSGLGPGAIVAGQYEAVEHTLQYEIERYSRADPSGYKVTDDTSQGGSAEALGWLMKLVWRHFKHTGDRNLLARAVHAFEPWIEAWTAREIGGLIVDVTDWMDHSRFLRLPEGQRTLYANALYYAALRRFAYAKRVLGDEDAAERYRERARNTRTAIHRAFWNEEGYFNHAILWDIPDPALMLADNGIALMERLATRADSTRTLDLIRDRNWRAYGTVTSDRRLPYVDDDNDQNAKVWPWWMALEARARFSYGDILGALHVLGRITATMERPTLPGLAEEYLNPDDGTQDEAVGHAFTTAAGMTLDALLYGLVGFSHLQPGDRAVRLKVRAPEEWSRWSARVHLFEGALHFERRQHAYRIRLEDTRVERLEVWIPPRQKVSASRLDGEPVEPEVQEIPESGAESVTFVVEPGGRREIEVEFKPFDDAAGPIRSSGRRPRGTAYPATPLVLTAPEPVASRHHTVRAHVAAFFEAVESADADRIADTSAEILVTIGNDLPYASPRGRPLTELFDAFLDRGRTLIVLGAAGEPLEGEGRMGARGGLFRWYGQRPGSGTAVNGHPEQQGGPPTDRGVVYWGEGPLFQAWTLRHGMFGFSAPCRGVFDSAGQVLDFELPVGTVYTDFAMRKPWVFRPLAFTRRQTAKGSGPVPERYPCAAAIENQATGAGIVLIAPALCRRQDLLHRLLADALHSVGAGMDE